MYARIQDDGRLRWQRSRKLPVREHKFATDVVDNIPDWITADETLMGKYGLFNLRQFLHEYCQPFQLGQHLQLPNVIYYLVIKTPEVERAKVSTLFSGRFIFLGTCPTKSVFKPGRRRVCR